VLVGVEQRDHVRQLVRTGGDLASHGSGTVRVVTVAAKPHDSPFSVFTDDTIRREFAADSRELLDRAVTPSNVAVEREILVDRSATRGILRAVDACEASALVVGWRGRSRRTDAVFGTTVDALVERAACDLYVERVGREAGTVDAVLLPVAGGPHVRAAARAAKAIAARNDAPVSVLSVAAEGVGRDAASRFVSEARDELAAVPGPEIRIETAVRDAADVTDAVVAAAADHDVLVLGTTRQGRLRQRLLGSVPGRVVERTDATVILARDGDATGGPLSRLGRTLRR
jgi:nucleotide-binding universal stress UspA family protein